MKLIRHLTLLALPSVIAVPALAADMPYKAPPRAAAPYSWSGIYIGGNVGAGFGKADVRGNDLPISSTIDLPDGLDDFEAGLAALINNGTSSFSQGKNPNGLIGGAQIGFNVQSGAFVFGLEADFQGSMQKDQGSASGAFDQPFSVGIFGGGFGVGAFGDLAGTQDTQYQTKIDWFGTVRGRLGYAQDTLLLYATGGLAYGRVKLDGTTSTDGAVTGTGCIAVCAFPLDIPFESNASSFGASKVNYGWTLGGGIEWAATANLSFKAEYLYMDLGSVTAHGTSPSEDDYTVHAKFTNQVARVGFNYKLGSP